jgi:hypothetical protein
MTFVRVASVVTVVPPPGVPTVSPAVAVWLPEDAVPVRVSDEVPLGVEASVVTVSVEPLPAATGFGLNVAVAPAGSPLALSVMLPGVPDTSTATS